MESSSRFPWKSLQKTDKFVSRSRSPSYQQFGQISPVAAELLTGSMDWNTVPAEHLRLEDALSEAQAPGRSRGAEQDTWVNAPQHHQEFQPQLPRKPALDYQVPQQPQERPALSLLNTRIAPVTQGASSVQLNGQRDAASAAPYIKHGPYRTPRSDRQGLTSCTHSRASQQQHTHLHKSQRISSHETLHS
jgi:hypothetical protein